MVEQAAAAGSAAPTDPNEEFLSRIGHMTRALHENLRGLGLDKLIEKAATDIPDARDRLDYVARLSEDAAQKVLNATDEAGPLQDGISKDAKELSSSWQALLDGQGGKPAQGDPSKPQTSNLRMKKTANEALEIEMSKNRLTTIANFGNLFINEILSEIMASKPNLLEQTMTRSIKLKCTKRSSSNLYLIKLSIYAVFLI